MKEQKLAEAGTVSIKDSVGYALQTVRARWRFVLAVAAVGAAAHGVALLVAGSALLFLPVVILVSAGVYSALLRGALDGPAAVRANLLRDTGRVAAIGAILGFILVMIALVVAYVAITMLIAPHLEEAKAIGEDQAAMTALLQRAMAEQPSVSVWAMAIGFAIMFMLTSRFYLAAPASLDQNKLQAFASWRWTKNAWLKIAGARLLLLAPALVFAGALQSLFGLVAGMNVQDAAALAAHAQSNPFGFIVFYIGAQFLQIAVYSSLEAGLSAALYRNMQPQLKASAG